MAPGFYPFFALTTYFLASVFINFSSSDPALIAPFLVNWFVSILSIIAAFTPSVGNLQPSESI